MDGVHVTLCFVVGFFFLLAFWPRPWLDDGRDSRRGK